MQRKAIYVQDKQLNVFLSMVTYVVIFSQMYEVAVTGEETTPSLE